MLYLLNLEDVKRQKITQRCTSRVNNGQARTGCRIIHAHNQPILPHLGCRKVNLVAIRNNFAGLPGGGRQRTGSRDAVVLTNDCAVGTKDLGKNGIIGWNGLPSLPVEAERKPSTSSQ